MQVANYEWMLVFSTLGLSVLLFADYMRWSWSMYQGRRARRRGRFEIAERWLLRGLELSRRANARTPELTRFNALQWLFRRLRYRETLSELVRTYLALGRLEEAEPLLEESLAIGAELSSVDTDGSLKSFEVNDLVSFGDLCISRDKDVNAERMFRRALAMIASLSNPECVYAIHAHAGLGSVFRARRMYEESEREFALAIAIAGDIDRAQVGRVFHELALTYFDAGRYRDAELTLMRARAALMDRFGDDHPEICACLESQSVLYRVLGRYADACEHARKSIEMEKRLKISNLMNAGARLTNFAMLSLSMGRLDDAERASREAVSRSPASNGPQLAMRLLHFASVLEAKGAHLAASVELERALEILRASSRRENSNIALVLERLGSVKAALGALDEGAELIESALAVHGKSGSAQSSRAHCLARLADVYRRMGRAEEAHATYVRSIQLFEGCFSSGHPDLLAPLLGLCDLLLDARRFEEADAALNRARELIDGVIGRSHPLTVLFLTLEGRRWRTCGRHDRAAESFAAAMSVAEKALPSDHPQVARLLAEAARTRDPAFAAA